MKTILQLEEFELLDMNYDETRLILKWPLFCRFHRSFFGSRIALSLPIRSKKAFGIFIILLEIKMVFWK